MSRICKHCKTLIIVEFGWQVHEKSLNSSTLIDNSWIWMTGTWEVIEFVSLRWNTYEYFKVHSLICFVPHKARTSPVAQIVKNLPAMQETWIQSLGREDPLEKEMGAHFSILSRRISSTGEPGRLQSMGSQESGTI